MGWGCVVPPVVLTPQAETVRIADENIVRPCLYLGDVPGSRYQVDDSTYRIGVLNTAAAMEATHVVFISQTLARAYRCPTAVAAPALAPAQGDGGSSDHVAKVRAREQAAGAAADQN